MLKHARLDHIQAPYQLILIVLLSPAIVISARRWLLWVLGASLCNAISSIMRWRNGLMGLVVWVMGLRLLRIEAVCLNPQQR